MTLAPPMWTNWIGDYAAYDLTYHVPKTKEDLVEIVEYAVANDKRIRASGAGHSTTSVARPDDIRVIMEELQGSLEVDYLKSSKSRMRPNLVRLKAGTRLKYANRVLLGDKAVANMGSFDWQTMIGAISTGTHGSSIHTGPMAESVRSIEMVTVTKVDGEPNIRMRRIEPTDGITDRDAFERDTHRHDTELIQDDDTFYSAVVSFGSIGLVYSLTLEVLDQYWLKEKNEAIEWDQVKQRLQLVSRSGFDHPVPRAVADNRFWEFLVNSADAQGSGDVMNPLCVVRTRNDCPQSPMPKPADWDSDLSWPPRRIEAPLLQQFGEAHLRPNIDTKTGSLTANAAALGVRGFFGWLDRKEPFEGKLDYSRNYWVLRRERDISKPQEEPDPPPEAISNEIAVPIENTVAAVDRILGLMNRSRDFYAVPFGVRFVAPSSHYLAMQYDRPTCMIEVPMALPFDANERADQMRRYKGALEAIENALCYDDGHLGGRPHWGQYNALNRANLEDLYDKLPVFERVYSQHNAFGTFDNSFTRDIGLIRSDVVEEPEEEEKDWTPLYIAMEHAL